MKLKTFSNFESDFIGEYNDGQSIVDKSCNVPQAAKIQSILAAGESLLNFAPPAGAFEQAGSTVDESLKDDFSDFADIADVDNFLKTEADSALGKISDDSSVPPVPPKSPVQNGAENMAPGSTAGGGNPGAAGV